MDPGKTIRNFRQLHGLRQKDVGDAVHVSSMTISSWERNVNYITFENFEKIMNFLGYEVVIIKKRRDTNEHDRVGKGRSKNSM